MWVAVNHKALYQHKVHCLSRNQMFPCGSCCGTCLLIYSAFFQETRNCPNYAIIGSVKPTASFLSGLGNKRESFAVGDFTLCNRSEQNMTTLLPNNFWGFKICIHSKFEGNSLLNSCEIVLKCAFRVWKGWDNESDRFLFYQPWPEALESLQHSCSTDVSLDCSAFSANLRCIEDRITWPCFTSNSEIQDEIKEWKFPFSTNYY